jgi:hypothetical protein
VINTLINLRQRYKNSTRKQYNKYYFEYDFKPNFKWNPFDTNNDFVYDNQKWYNFLCGWIGIGYAFEAWSYLMRDKKYSYKLPDAFWTELSDGWMEMEVYSWTKK